MRVIIADDSVIVREGLERLLGSDGHEVVATFNRPDALAAAVASQAPDALVVDIRMPPTHTDEGLQAAARLRADHPQLGILVLSQYVVPEYAMRLLRDGERYTGYLLKDRILEREELLRALEEVVGGGTVVDPELVNAMFAVKRREEPISRLSDREREVLQLMAEGRSDKGIAERLYVSPNTVGTHIQHIFQKLGLPEGATENRRVLAVLNYLHSSSLP